MKIEEVTIIYSSKRNPEAQKLFSEDIAYLRETGTNAQLIDIDEKPDLAEKYRIMSTPILLIRKNGELNKYIVDIIRLKEIFLQTCLGTISKK